MLLFDFVRLILVFALLICASCGVWQPAENVNSTLHITEKIETGIPFQNKEPEKFQTEIVVTSLASGESGEKRYFLARNGLKYLTVFNRGERGETSVLQTEDGKVFSINNE